MSQERNITGNNLFVQKSMEYKWQKVSYYGTKIMAGELVRI